MANKPQFPVKPGPRPTFPPTVPAPLEPYFPGDALPVPDVIEKDSDSVWALWSDAVKGKVEKKNADGHAATQLMDLDDLPSKDD